VVFVLFSSVTSSVESSSLGLAPLCLIYRSDRLTLEACFSPTQEEAHVTADTILDFVSLKNSSLVTTNTSQYPFVPFLVRKIGTVNLLNKEEEKKIGISFNAVR
jgi:hypothetical protein